MHDETFMNERVTVVAEFKEGFQPCVPLRFTRANGREIEVTELGLRHPTVKGRRTLHVFELTDGCADYRLEFDSESLTWYLTAEMDHYE